jgi:predicted alpha/beta-fold hydrolase
LSTINTYKPLRFLRGQHLETILPNLLRNVKQTEAIRERVDTPDGDFLDLDWHLQGSSTLAIISHGLEGNSNRPYMKGMAKIFTDNNIDALCWNFRGCGSEMNIKPRLYHSGATTDLDTVVQVAVDKGYEQIVLIGFSLGGNITLKYAGEQGKGLSRHIKAAIAFSVPLDLAAGGREISKPHNWMYCKRFLKNLKIKIRLKHLQFPEIIKLNGLNKVNNLRDFDDIYTGPIHGFAGADDYYFQSSAIRFLEDINIPSLIVNAKNDPFLPEECYPFKLIEQCPKIVFETPDHGGHVGFVELNRQGYYWSDKRALAFVTEHLALD